MYAGSIKVRISGNGEVDIIGNDGTTFIATFGYGPEAKELAQKVVDLWNATRA